MESANDEDGGEDDGEKSGDDDPADPTSENSGEAAETYDSVFDKAARGSSEPFSGMQW
jgi:hypothetical protein